jgi:hypothetical protein
MRLRVPIDRRPSRRLPLRSPGRFDLWPLRLIVDAVRDRHRQPQAGKRGEDLRSSEKLHAVALHICVASRLRALIAASLDRSGNRQL